MGNKCVHQKERNMLFEIHFLPALFQLLDLLLFSCIRTKPLSSAPCPLSSISFYLLLRLYYILPRKSCFPSLFHFGISSPFMMDMLSVQSVECFISKDVYTREEACSLFIFVIMLELRSLSSFWLFRASSICLLLAHLLSKTA